MRFLARVAMLLAAGLLGGACSSGPKVKPAERQFYKNPHVRHCLQYDKEQKTTESQACWARLLAKIQSEPDFVKDAQLTEADIAKVRWMSAQSARCSDRLQEELDRCLNIPSRDRARRIDCFQEHLSRHDAELNQSQKFEIQSAIAALKQSQARASGEVEATIEHAGKLLGAELHLESEGVRIHAVGGGPMAQAGLAAQGIIVSLDQQPVSDLSPAERIARLEACEDRPLQMLVRHGGIGNITFTRAEVRCGKEPAGRHISAVVLENRQCTAAGDPELRLGISWCYLASDGVLEVREVCADSPATLAGVRRGHRYVSINGTQLLGLTSAQIGQLCREHPQTPLHFEEQGGALHSPVALDAPPLDPERTAQCWRAISSTGGGQDAADSR